MFLKKIVLALVALIVFGMSWRAGDVVGINIAGLGLVAVFGLLAFVFAIAFLLFGRHEPGRAPVPMDAAVLLFGVFVVINFASIGWAEHPNIAVSSAISYFQLLTFVWLLAFLRSEKTAFPLLLRAYLLGLSVIAIGSIIEVATLSDGLEETRGRNFGIDRNTVAFKTVLGIPVAVYLFRRSSVTRHRWLYLAYLPLGVAAVVLTGSRTGLLALGWVLAALTWLLIGMEKRGTVRFSATRTLVAVGALAAVVVSLIPYLAERLPRHIERFSTLADPMASNVGGRGDMWAAAIEVYLNNFLLGIGSGGGGTAILSYFEGDVYVFTFLDQGVSLHNVFLAIATGTGTVGLLLFLAVILALILRTVSFPREERLLFLSMIGASLVMALTLGLEQSRDFFFALFLPVALSLAHYPAGARARSRRRTRFRPKVGPDSRSAPAPQPPHSVARS